MIKKLLIEGMSCNHCINHLKTALTEDIEAIKVLEVNLDDKYAIIDMKDGIDLNQLKQVIESLDFELKDIIEC